MMEVECLALKDLTSPRKSFTVGSEENGGQSEQKENICTERRKSTPLKSAEPTISTLQISRKAATSDLGHITPIKRVALAEPWTPTANLKMLISAASPDIRDRELKKVLFRPIENEKEKPASPDTVTEETEVDESCQFEAVDEEDETEKKPSRKQKSLGLLCQKFLALYPDYPPLHIPISISLDEVATNLGVERRRIYDIVNVLESLMIVGRIAKNSYTWHGRQQLEATLQKLQQEGRKQGYHLQMDLVVEAREAGKDKSLRIMSQKFVMLFLVSKTQTVTLDAAAKILIEESQDSSSHSKYKTKVRRLYDIANVLTSLNLIKKVHVREERGRKPAFKWLGPVEFNNSGNASKNKRIKISHSKMARHASFNITPTSVAVQRQVNSAPSSPRKDLPLDYSKKSPSSNAVCRLQFGNSSESWTAALVLFSNYLKSLYHMDKSRFFSFLHPSCWFPLQVRAEAHREGGDCSQVDSTRTSPCHPAGPSGVFEDSRGGNSRSEPTQPSHYLYIPNNAGLNSLNLFLPASQPSSSLALPPSAVPALALPYVLLPPAALSHYPLLASSLQQQGSDAHTKVSFSVPAVMSPAHFTVGTTPYSLATTSEVGWSPAQTPSTPEKKRVYGSAAGTSNSPPGPRQTPHTPKDTTAAASKAFFQTPGTLGSVVSAVAATRKRGSAQRRLDVGHPPTS
uniref:Transcription factor E2F7 n=1 Tax=Echeneis naucrates TaxID=173247 RepID=A0A665VCR8_ECHNA